MGDRPRVALAIDIGGTFTDVVLVAATADLTVAKVYDVTGRPGRRPCSRGTRPSSTAVRRGGRRGRRASVHGTTLATNVILERRGVAVAFVTTAGFRSMLELGRYGRVEEERFDLFFDPGDPPVPITHVFEVPERLGPGGEVLRPLDEEAVQAAAQSISRLGVAAVAVCLLHSYANPAHERRVTDIFARCPRRFGPGGRRLRRSSRRSGSTNEPPTTLMSAYVGPVMSAYLERLERRLLAIGVDTPIHIMECSGGVMSVAVAARRAVYTIESGPAAAVVAAQELGKSYGYANLISFDMGGTTAKAGLVRDGRPDLTYQFKVGGKASYGGRRSGSGVPVRVPAIDLAEVGSGEGASSGSIRPVSCTSVRTPPAVTPVRPATTEAESSPPSPMPISSSATSASTFAGGTMTLSRSRAEEAIGAVADRLGVEPLAAASAVYEIVNANMGAAVDVVTVQRGVDPRIRHCSLGGAAPMHVARVAEHFGIDHVLVPAPPAWLRRGPGRHRPDGRERANVPGGCGARVASGAGRGLRRAGRPGRTELSVDPSAAGLVRERSSTCATVASRTS